MTLGQLGEFGFIARIARRAARSGHESAGVMLGIGDDAAVLRLRPRELLVVSTDAAVEDVHFRWRTTPARLVGRRAILAALSDLSAMGARALGFTFALAAPAGLSLPRLDACVEGLLAEAVVAGCPLVGGNVTRAKATSLTLTVLGAVPRGQALRRSAARAGDRIFVTGVLGAAALDLARAERRGGKSRHVPPLRLGAGRALARLPQAGACIDLSDGLLADLGHVLVASGVGAELDLSRLPLPPGFAAASARLGLDPRSLASFGGEDYELLFTLRPGPHGEAALARRIGAPVREIGRITRRRGLRGAEAGGFAHF